MITIPFVEKIIHFRTDLGVLVQARRPYLTVELRGP